jgi:ABC 3 transport family/Heavy metal associated domain 2
MHRARHNEVRLRSAVSGRMRWEAAGLRNHPRKAAAIEMALGHMPGILSVEATPLTGRILVRYDKALTVEEISAMVRAALYTPAFIPEASEAPQEQTVDGREGAVHVRHEGADGQSHNPESGRTLLRGHWRRLFLAGLALTHRVPVRLLGVLFFLLLALAVTVSWLATGLLLVLSLLMVPSATAQLLTARLSRLIVYAAGCAALSICLGLWLAAQILWLPSAFVAITSFAWYLGVRALVARGGRLVRGCQAREIYESNGCHSRG